MVIIRLKLTLRGDVVNYSVLANCMALPTLMEKRIRDKMNPLFIDEIKEDLKLRYERTTSKSESTKHEDFDKERALFAKQ